MAQKQRQMKMQQTSALGSIQELENRSDAELAQETRNRAAAQALLGARAAERYDAEKAREHFRRAIAAARPQERMHIRRMADASLALAERRPNDLKAAVERLGQTAPTGRQLFALRVFSIIAPPKSAGLWARTRGILAVVAFVILLLAVGFGIVALIGLISGSGVPGIGAGLFYSFLLILLVIGILVLVGRRRQAKARSAASKS